MPTSTLPPCNQLVWIFGSFREPFEDVPIPSKMVKAYKAPISWPRAGLVARLERFVDDEFRGFQHADLEF